MPTHLTRIAPTPSGMLHWGNAFSFLLTQRVAQKTGANILLRIDDLYNEHTQPEFVSDILAGIKSLGISYQGPQTVDEFNGTWSQWLRVPLYQTMLDRLVQTGQLYACTCSRKQLADDPELLYNHPCRHHMLPLSTPDAAWRIALPPNATVRFVDGHLGPQHLDLNQLMPDPVVRRRDGVPAYQVASLADDVHFGIDLIVRGHDLLGPTAIQLYLAQLLKLHSFTEARFVHHPLILGMDGNKLSKSAGHGAQSALQGPDHAAQLAYIMQAVAAFGPLDVELD